MPRNRTEDDRMTITVKRAMAHYPGAVRVNGIGVPKFDGYPAKFMVDHVGMLYADNGRVLYRWNRRFGWEVYDDSPRQSVPEPQWWQGAVVIPDAVSLPDNEQRDMSVYEEEEEQEPF